jgi:hypothetical protein
MSMSVSISIEKFLDLLDELDKLENDIDKDILITTVLSNSSVNEVMKMSLVEYAELKQKYDINSILNKQYNTNKIVHNNVEYEFRVDISKMTVQEWGDLSLIEQIQDRKERILKTMCLLSWTQDEKSYDGKYKLSRINEIKEMDAGEVWSVSSFFLSNLENLKKVTQLCIQKAQMITQKQEDIAV